MVEQDKNDRTAAKTLRLKGLRILIVDDTLDNRILEKMYLMSEGASVELADNGEKGVQMAMSQHFDAILMDLHMPCVDGFKATERLRCQGFEKPIIAVTANTLPETKNTAMKNGFSEFLTKPLSRKTLIETIDHIFSCSRENAIQKSLQEITNSATNKKAEEFNPPSSSI